ncbi:MAG: polysaccharide biosynthesis/export family protein [Bryobacteraceae bacterium]
MKKNLTVLIALWTTCVPSAALADPPPRSTYVLGPEDRVVVQAFELEELAAEPVRIDENGDLSLAILGTVHAAGLTVRELEIELVARAKRYVKEPRVTIRLGEMRSQPVSVLGAVNSPGVHQLQGQKSLIQILSMAGGLRPDAGHTAKITRQSEWGAIPLPGADNSAAGYSVAEVAIKDMLEAANPAENIAILPHDVITIPRAEMVYVIGDVKRPGGHVLGQSESVSVLQALALAEGLERTASPQSAKILRASGAGEQRQEIAVDVRKILIGQSVDVPLKRDDILFIPGSAAKRASWRVLESVLQIGTGIAIYRR